VSVTAISKNFESISAQGLQGCPQLLILKLNQLIKYSSKRQSPLVLDNGKKAELYFFTGDRWGNYEVVTYFQEANNINFLVFNARSKESFDKYLDDFKQIARSYRDFQSGSKEVTH
jgi:hypothetical protein